MMANADAAPTPLLGRKALVLGAGSPAGRRVAVALAEAGADVAVASASLDGDEVMACRRTRRAIEALGRRTAEYAFDVTLGQNVQVSTRQVAKELGGLDILVWAVHQSMEGKPASKITDAEWSRALSANLDGAFFACRASVREMEPAGGRIILLDLQAFQSPNSSRFIATVAGYGLQGLWRAFSDELRDQTVRIDYVLVTRGVPPDEQPAELGAMALPPELGEFAAQLAGTAEPSTATAARLVDASKVDRSQ